MPEKDQVFIFSNDELSLIKNTFADNDTLLYTIRKVFLQFPLTDTEKGLLKMAITPEVWKVLKKRILPEISNEFPLGQLPSILTTLTEQLKVKDAAEMADQFTAKQLEIDYLTQCFNTLKDLDTPQTISIKKMGDTIDYVNMNAYLFLLGYIDPMLGFIKSLAGQKDETLEEQKKRLTRDSNK